MTRRFQNTTPIAQPLPDQTLETGEIATFEGNVPHDVTLMARNGTLLELEDEPKTEKPASRAKGGKD